MNPVFERRFGKIDLGPRDRADYGRVLYDDRGVKRYHLDTLSDKDSWSIDAQTGERAFRIDAQHRVYLPSGQQIVPTPEPAHPRDIAGALYGRRTSGSPEPATEGKF